MEGQICALGFQFIAGAAAARARDADASTVSARGALLFSSRSRLGLLDDHVNGVDDALQVSGKKQVAEGAATVKRRVVQRGGRQRAVALAACPPKPGATSPAPPQHLTGRMPSSQSSMFKQTVELQSDCWRWERGGAESLKQHKRGARWWRGPTRHSSWSVTQDLVNCGHSEQLQPSACCCCAPGPPHE